MPYEDFEVLVKQWMRRFASQAGMALCAVILFALGATLLYLGMFGLTDPASAKHVFSPEWYKGNLHQRILLMYYLGAWCALAGGAGAWLFLVNIPFLFKLGRIRAVPMPTVLLAQFRSASDFYLMGTTAWFVAVAMAVLLIFRNISATAIAFLIVCGVIGLSAFLFPQFIFHKFLVRAQSHIATIALDEYNSTSSIAIPTAGVASDLQRLATLSDLTQPGPMWVYDLTDVAVFLISNSIAPLALAAKAFAASYISSLVSH